MILDIIDALKTATSLSVKPFGTETIEDCIIYNCYSNYDNGGRSRWRLEIRLITQTMADAEEYRQKIINTLVPIGDNIKIDGILGCELNGGGSLREYSTNTIHTLMYFDIVTRSETNE